MKKKKTENTYGVVFYIRVSKTLPYINASEKKCCVFAMHSILG